MAFLVMGLQFAVNQRFNFIRVEVARDHHAQIVGQELCQVVVFDNVRIRLKQLGFVGRIDVLFNRHQAFLAGFLQNVKQQGHQLQVAFFGVNRTL